MRCIGPEEYDELCRRVEAVVRDATPADAVVAVISKGDPRLVEIEGRTGLHFPRGDEGRYAGHYPETSEDAIGQLEALRATGAQYLCLPATALWWLDHYQALAAWLDAHCHVAVRDPETCLVYDLTRPPGEVTAADPSSAAAAQVRSLLDALLPEGALLLVVGAPPDGLAARGRAVASLGPTQAAGMRRLTGLKVDRPTFVLIGREPTAPPLDPVFESFLARRTVPVAQRQHLCDVLEFEAERKNPSRIRRSDPAGGNSSGPGDPPITKRQT